jgi:hypothetical protein
MGQAGTVVFAHNGAKKERAVAPTVPVNRPGQPHEVAEALVRDDFEDGLGTTKASDGLRLLDDVLCGRQGGIGKLQFESSHQDAILSKYSKLQK